MVVFTCNHCGDSVQKPKIVKHYDMKCRRPKDLTCVDCLKDFRGEEYAVHTSCVTEDQRYAAKGTEIKPLKGMQKQESWVDIIQACYDTEAGCKTGKIQAVFKNILGQTNIPRKKAKFMNYIGSAFGNRINKNDASEAFDLIQSYFLKQKDAKKAEEPKGDSDNTKEIEKNDESSEKEEGEGKNKKKRKVSETEEIKSAVVEEPKKKKKKNKQSQSKAAEGENGQKNNSKIPQNESIIDNSTVQNGGDSSNALETSALKNANKKNKNKQQTDIIVKADSSANENDINNVNTSAANSESQTKKKKNRRNKKKQNGPIDSSAAVQNGVGTSNALEVKVGKKKNENKQNEDGSSNALEIALKIAKKKNKNKQQNGSAPTQDSADSPNVAENGNDKGVVISKSKKRRQKHMKKLLKKIDETGDIQGSQLVTEKTEQKNHKKDKNVKDNVNA